MLVLNSAPLAPFSRVLKARKPRQGRSPILGGIQLKVPQIWGATPRAFHALGNARWDLGGLKVTFYTFKTPSNHEKAWIIVEAFNYVNFILSFAKF